MNKPTSTVKDLNPYEDEILLELDQMQLRGMVQRRVSGMREFLDNPAPVGLLDVFTAVALLVVVSLAVMSVDDNVRMYLHGLPGVPLFKALFLAIPLVLTAWYYRIRFRLPKLIGARLENSGIVEKLANDPHYPETLFEALPSFFPAFFYRKKVIDKLYGIKLIATNLDWFLEPRERLFRLEWLIIPLNIVFFASTVATLSGPLQTPPYFNPAKLALWFHYYTLPLLCAYIFRASLGARALSAYLQDRFRAED